MVGRARKGSRSRTGARRPLFIGLWLHRLGLRQTDIAEAAKITEGYLSQLISGERDNPSAAVLFAIAAAMGIDPKWLYEPPPDRSVVAAASNLPLDLLLRLRNTDPE